jgi:tRNA (adenine37-N6)-methyltransferase
MTLTIKPIGIIHTPYKTKEDCPIQGQAMPEGKGQIEVFPEYLDGLHTLETFSHLIILYHFDRAGEVEMQRKPFSDDEIHGLFATRHPCRPNKIGFSIVKLEKINGNILEISEIDALDKTPLIDIKPYVPRFDHRLDANNGWLEGKTFRPKPEGRE